MEGRPGSKETFYNVSKRLWWPKIQQDVAEYVRNCNECQRNEEISHKPYGKMQSEMIPETTWKQIVTDFIEPLPESKDPTTGEKCKRTVGCRGIWIDFRNMLFDTDTDKKRHHYKANGALDDEAMSMYSLTLTFHRKQCLTETNWLSQKSGKNWHRFTEFNTECLQQIFTQRQDKLND